MASNGKITREFFGLHIGHNGTFWPTVPLCGTWRSWDQVPSWHTQQPTQGVAPNFGTITATGINTDTSVDAAISHGAQPILTLGNTPAWASLSQITGAATTGLGNPTNTISAYSSGSNAPPQTLQDWIDYVTAVGTHFLGRVHHYEIWNEVNDPRFFSGTIGGLADSPSPGTIGYGPGSDMYNLVKAASIALKAIDPTIKIISPSMTGWPAATAQFPTLIHDLLPYIDIVAYHFYSGQSNSPASLRGCSPDWPIYPASQISQMSGFRERLAAVGVPDTMPIWNTEFGYVFTNGDGTAASDVASIPIPEGDWQCGLLMRSFLIGAASGIERCCWYTWDNTAMGMIEPTTLAAPGATATSVAYKACVGALQVLERWLIGRYVSDIVWDKTGNFFSVELTDDDGFVGRIVWNANYDPATYYPHSRYKYYARYELASAVPGGGQIYQSNAASLPVAMDPPSGDIIPNSISLVNGLASATPQNLTYSTTQTPDPYWIETNPPPVQTDRISYGLSHKQYAGYGVRTQKITNASITLWASPVLLIG